METVDKTNEADDSIYDRLPISDSEIEIDNTNETVNTPNSTTNNNINDSALSQLLDYGLSDSDESISDSADSLKPKQVDNNTVGAPNPNSNTNYLSYRSNDIALLSSDSNTASEYESDSSSSTYSDVGACGVSNASSDNNNSVCSNKSVNKKKRIVLSTKGELSLDQLPPVEELKINVSADQCMEIGVVSSIIEQLVIVQSHRGTPAYDIDTLLFLDHGSRPLGRVFDVLGPVTEPYYAVRFNTFEQALETGVKSGTLVYCAPKTQHTSFVFVNELIRMKGSDASWEHNNEPPETCLEYSDDEEERRVRRFRTEQRSKNSSLERNKTFEREMNNKNSIITERYKSQQQQQQQQQNQYQQHLAMMRKRRPIPELNRRTPVMIPALAAPPPAAATTTAPTWMLPPPPTMQTPPRPDFWQGATPFQFFQYGTPAYGPLFMGPTARGGAMFPAAFSPNVAPIPQTQMHSSAQPPVGCFRRTPTSGRWIPPAVNLSMLRQPPPPPPPFPSSPQTPRVLFRHHNNGTYNKQ